MLHTILIIAALVCFLLAAFNVPAKVHLGWTGAFLLALTLLL